MPNHIQNIFKIKNTKNLEKLGGITMKNYTVEVETKEKPYKHFIIVSASDEIEAIDKVAEHYMADLNKEIIDIKVI